MDRFIGQYESYSNLYSYALKSNMDRFIELTGFAYLMDTRTLKSNMDRFIVKHLLKKPEKDLL